MNTSKISFPKICLIVYLTLMSSKILADCSYPDDPTLAAQKSKCDEEKSKKWDCTLNRCITTDEAVKLEEDHQECSKLTSESARQKCFDQLARNESGNLSTDNPNTTLGHGTYALSITLATINFTSKNKPEKKCISASVFNAAAVASLASELYYYFKLKKDLEKIKKKHKLSTDTSESESSTSESYTTQVDAFKALEAEQKAIAKMAKTRQQFFRGLSVLYAGAGAVALYETISPAATKCMSKSSYVPKNLLDFLMPTAYASDKDKIDLYLTLIGAAGGAAIGLTGKKWLDMLRTSAGIAVISGVCAVISNKLSGEFKDLKSQADSNAKKIAETLAKFEETMKKSCPSGRDDLNEPQCYCYTTDGEKNSERSNSETCQALWSKTETNYYVEDKDEKPKSEEVGCITIAGDFDKNCDCKKFIDKNGENACYKATSNVSSLGTLGAELGLQTLSNGVESIASGNYGYGSLIGDSNLKRQAAKTNKIVGRLIEQINKKRKKPIVIDENLTNSIIRSIANKEVMAQKDNNILGKGILSLGGKKPNSKGAAIVKKALKKAGLDKINFKGGKGTKKSIDEKDEFAFMGKTHMRGKVMKNSFMNKKYNYRDNDVVNRMDMTLWQILTNRYNQSGLRLLFKNE